MDDFERQVRQRLKKLGFENKVYLKKNYDHEIFTKHDIGDDEINYLFDMKKIIKIYPDNLAFPGERIIADINASKNKKFSIIFQFDPNLNEKKLKGKVGIITAY